MNENVRVVISAAHKMYDNTTDNHKIKEIYDGKYFYKNNSHFILYTSEDDEKKQISNTIKLEDSMISIVKKGNTKSTMHFSQGQKHKSDYITPFGTFGLETDTKKIDMDITEESIAVKLEYELWLNDAPSSNCNMTIIISNL